MAKGSIGKRVARAAATGGSRTRRGEVPIGFYTSLALIVIIGVFVVGYSRYERLNPTGSAAASPHVGQTWHVALGVYDCNTFLPNLPAQKSTSGLSFYTTGNGLITISPKSKLDEGSNANLGRFALNYPGLYFSSTKITYPGHSPLLASATCNGKPAKLELETWSSLLAKGVIVTQPFANLNFVDQELITVGLVASGSSLPKPQSAKALINLPLTQSLATTTTLAPTATVPQLTTTTSKTG